ncbi:MAG: hypothetical protein NT083_00945 [Rhodocyclales bacterium]|nr:hypothetical protein [Rhodocyclales bacterium]
MNTSNQRPAQTEAEAAWQHCPWGLVAIGRDGRVCRVNPAFEYRTGTAAATVLGMSESDFDALFNSPLPDRRRFGQRRVETGDEALRAIYYFFHAPTDSDHDSQLVHIAERMREPLASIYGFAELLLTQNYDEDTRRDLTGTLMEQVEVISNVINEELDTRNSAIGPHATAPRFGGGGPQ